jgi:prepilin peptidase CpaA
MVNPEYIIVGMVAALLLIAAVTDGYNRIIPDRVNLAIALLAIPFWWTTGLSLWPDVAWQLGVAALSFVILLGVFHIGQMGGGDVKLLVALALFLRPVDFMWMLFGMAMLGGVMTSAMLIHHRLLRPDKPFENPYGIAIAASTLLVLAGHYRLIDIDPVFAVLFRIALISCVATLAILIGLRLRKAR